MTETPENPGQVLEPADCIARLVLAEYHHDGKDLVNVLFGEFLTLRSETLLGALALRPHAVRSAVLRDRDVDHSAHPNSRAVSRHWNVPAPMRHLKITD